ncbi:hypothetical protein SGPA1_40233 [Streptomyces misionensis JCM 4497]
MAPAARHRQEEPHRRGRRSRRADLLLPGRPLLRLLVGAGRHRLRQVRRRRHPGPGRRGRPRHVGHRGQHRVGELQRRLHGGRVHRRQVAHQLAEMGPGQHPAQPGLPVHDLGQRLDEPALRHLAGQAAEPGRRHDPQGSATGADRAVDPRRRDPLRGCGRAAQASRRLPSDHREGRGFPRGDQPGEPLRQPARRRLSDRRHAGRFRRDLRPARHTQAVTPFTR